MTARMTTGALLLAAGSARRFGSAKQIATLRGQPLIVHAARALLAADLPVIVVTGAHADAVATALAALPLTLVHAPDHVLGMAHSLRAGLAAAPATWDAALIALADMPDLEPALLATLAATPGIALPVWNGQRGNPVRWPRAHWPTLMTLTGDEGARRLLPGLPVTEVPAPSAAIHRDIDRPEDL
ncbi:nucleotidyltransferase family protein [Polymorphobacter sp.]|uniref:nucleotidyltransferase family protein n=1 Tax=Polymorphobacter sp. TaxID=1909290 RepID=UPI003F72135A